MNPLKELCQQVGLTPTTIAQIANCSLASVNQAMSDAPAEPLLTYLRIAAAIGSKMRLVPSAPFAIWISVGAVDALYRDEKWRVSRGLLPLVGTRGELRECIRSLRAQKTHLEAIADRLEGSWIPTTEGCRNWRKTTVAQHLQAKGVDSDVPMPTTDAEWMDWKAWRAWVIESFMVELCPFDPVAAIRYNIEVKEDGGKFWITPTSRVPESAKRWMVSRESSVWWFPAGEWGVTDVQAVQPFAL